LCELHPDGCRNCLVLKRDDHGVGMQPLLRMMVPGELACYIIGSDGCDRCHVAFVAKEYMVGERGLLLNETIVPLIEAFFTRQ